jgi:hypothetical protein
MRHLRRTSGAGLIATLGLLLTLCASPATAATRIVPPAGTWDGLSAGDLLGDGWAVAYSTPAPESPLLGHPLCMHLGRTGGILYPVNSSPADACQIRQGAPVFINGLSTAWSSIEDPFPRDEATQQALSLASDEAATASIVTVDGGGAVDLRRDPPIYGIFAPQRSVKLPRDNVFGVPPQKITLSAHGWLVFVLGLAPGMHAIRSYNTFEDGSVYDFTKYVKVIRS